MKKTQDPKYGINDEGQICNIATGKPIPDDEPVFIFRAKDINALSILKEYSYMSRSLSHLKAIKSRIKDFTKFKQNHSSRMKQSDTVYPFPDGTVENMKVIK